MASEALEAILRERPDLVLLDVMMPVKSGFEVCQEVRANDAVKDTLILMLTAKGRDTDVAKGIGAGRRRLHDQAVLDQGAGAEGARDAGARPLETDATAPAAG